jgi:hypothetical protein
MMAGWVLWKENPQQVKAATFYVWSDWFSFVVSDDTVFGFTRVDGSRGSITAGEVRRLPAFRTASDAVLMEARTGTERGPYGAASVMLARAAQQAKSELN